MNFDSTAHTAIALALSGSATAAGHLESRVNCGGFVGSQKPADRFLRIFSWNLGQRQQQYHWRHSLTFTNWVGDNGQSAEKFRGSHSIPANKLFGEMLCRVVSRCASTSFKARRAFAGTRYRSVIATPDAPKAIGPYSQAICANGFVFVSGMIGFEPSTMELEPDVKSQTKRALQNMANILEVSGSSVDKVVKTTVLMQNMDDYKVINEIYAGVFKDSPPARVAYACKELPAKALVEIDCVALAEK